jgi:hypothetical protein
MGPVVIALPTRYSKRVLAARVICERTGANVKRALSYRRKYNGRGARRRLARSRAYAAIPFLSRRNHGDSFSRVSAALA